MLIGLFFLLWFKMDKIDVAATITWNSWSDEFGGWPVGKDSPHLIKGASKCPPGSIQILYLLNGLNFNLSAPPPPHTPEHHNVIPGPPELQQFFPEKIVWIQCYIHVTRRHCKPQRHYKTSPWRTVVFPEISSPKLEYPEWRIVLLKNWEFVFYEI